MKFGFGSFGKLGSSRGASGGGYLDSVLDSVCAEFDSSVVDSYDGSGQYWNSLTANPADGSTQANHQFILGSSSGDTTDDPDHDGTDFTFDGTQYFLSNNKQGILNTLHRTNESSPFWMAGLFYFPAGMQNGRVLMHTRQSGIGFNVKYIVKKAIPCVEFNIETDHGQAEKAWAKGVTLDAWNFFIFTCDVDAYAGGGLGDDVRTDMLCAVNTDVFSAALCDLDSWGYAGGGNAEKNINLCCANETGQLPITSGAKLRWLAWGNEVLSENNLGLMLDHLEERHSGL